MTSKNISNEFEQDTESDEEIDEDDCEFRHHQESQYDYKKKLRSHNLAPVSSPDALRNRNRMSSSSTNSQSKDTSKSLKSQKDSKKKSSNSVQYLFLICILVIVIAIFSIFFIKSEQDEIDKCSTSLILDKNGDVCVKQGMLCNVVSKGIRQLVNNPDKPIMFVLLAHRNNIDTAKCLSKAIASFGSCKLNTNGSVILTPRGFSYNTDEIIEKFKTMFENYRSVVFENLMEMDVLALRAMHNICDSYNPLVKPAIYTIIVVSDDNIIYDNAQSWIQLVRNMLKKKFENINIDKIEPLITRITDGPILPVFPGQITNCHEQSDYFEVV